MDGRHHLIAQLRSQLADLIAKVKATAVCSHERTALLVLMEPLLNTLLSLAEELEELPVSPQSH